MNPHRVAKDIPPRSLPIRNPAFARRLAMQRVERMPEPEVIRIYAPQVVEVSRMARAHSGD